MKTIKLLSKDNETLQQITVNDDYFTESSAINIKPIIFPECEKLLGTVEKLSVDETIATVNVAYHLFPGIQIRFFPFSIIDEDKKTDRDNTLQELVRCFENTIYEKDNEIRKIKNDLLTLSGAVYLEDKELIKEIMKKFAEENEGLLFTVSQEAEEVE